MPALIAHFYGHEKEDNQTGLLALLMLHYGSPIHSDNDDEQDEQLPFKNVENDLIFTPSVSPAIFKVNVIVPVRVTKLIATKSILPSLHLHDFWQPPRQFFAA